VKRILLALALLPMAGCAFVDHVQVLPVVNPTTYDASCCVAFFELGKRTDGSIEVQKTPTHLSVSAKVRQEF
jgi:hypothetical protein